MASGVCNLLAFIIVAYPGLFNVQALLTTKPCHQRGDARRGPTLDVEWCR
jgi:hypothetical protein